MTFVTEMRSGRPTALGEASMRGKDRSVRRYFCMLHRSLPAWFVSLMISFALAFGPYMQLSIGQTAVSAIVPHRFIVGFKDAAAWGQMNGLTVSGRIVSLQDRLGLAVIESASDTAATDLARLPGVDLVVADRMVAGSSVKAAAVPAGDAIYNSPQGWAVKQVGGFGSSAGGPWSVTKGAGVRIAILDSGVDAGHPDLAPNLALNLSEVNQDPATGLPSPCDDGSAQDQEGHGTWTASLAAGALGVQTGEMAGVAPEATLLNIKVLERMPATRGNASSCAAGEASGLLSWVIQGINDAVANHADVISMSLGTLVDITSGDGAGVKTLMDRATHAAANAGAVLVAAAGNDGFSLDNLRYVELPAQSRDVLAIVAATNPGCAENLAAGATCKRGMETLPYYSNFGAALNALAAPGGSYPAGPDDDLSAASGWIRGACSEGKPSTVDGAPVDGAHSFGCFGLGHAAYVQAMGTSASAPLAAGAAALVKAAHPGWTAAQIVQAMRQNALPAPGMPVGLVDVNAIVTGAGLHNEHILQTVSLN